MREGDYGYNSQEEIEKLAMDSNSNGDLILPIIKSNH
jgi:hypothetical protein